MHNIWLVARHEFRRTVIRRGFILMTLAIPVAIAVLFGAIILVEQYSRGQTAVGYVDHARLLNPALYDAEEADAGVRFVAFSDEASAQAAIEQETIDAFFVLPADYPQTLETDLTYRDSPPGNNVWNAFDDFVRHSLVASQPTDIQTRLLEGSEMRIHDVASGRTFQVDSLLNFVLPFAAMMVFILATMAAAGYMMQVVTDEKESRTMEVLITTVTPGQLISGKSLGLLAAALTQLLIYILAGVAILIVARPAVPALQGQSIPWDYVLVLVLYFLPTYALISAIMVAIGSAVTDVQQGQQVAGILLLIFVVPVFVTPLILEDPSRPLVTFFTLFPTSAFLTILLRWGIGTIPLWQLALSWSILVASAALMFWAAARIFRAGMLQYGQPLSLKTAVAAVRGS